MTDITFTKMHGCGNDFVVLDCMKPRTPLQNLAKIAEELCCRRFGVGADQLLTIKPPSSDLADFTMEIYNADGSEVEMCGNGIRCFAKYVYEHGLTDKREIKVDTPAGVIRTWLKGDRVQVDMGRPVLDGRRIPVDADGRIVNHQLKVDGTEYTVTCVSMGNPHCVVYVDDADKLDKLDLPSLGPSFECHAFFPKRVNTEFFTVLRRDKVLRRDEVRMRVWERGAGETLACGTGASAVCVAGVLTGKTDRKITVHLRCGEDLEIDWVDEDRVDKDRVDKDRVDKGRVYMTGPAQEVFQGSVPYPSFPRKQCKVSKM